MLLFWCRAVKQLEIQTSSCIAKGVMQLITVTVCSLHTSCFWDVQNVSSGPYLCPKHTKCHSCCSSVPGNGLSVRGASCRSSIYVIYCDKVCESNLNQFSSFGLAHSTFNIPH
ncbi:hypothetical protein MTR67_004198 [Solanum verrucosum]|uniref:Uncharacterized protein n=1 Tax=Solanum verrucosum TaxID=315347 RepID=A0AAF0PTN6_SOLVR|nr:hypothetical protein MTR67_004198 [Solanum verrucosum]